MARFIAIAEECDATMLLWKTTAGNQKDKYLFQLNMRNRKHSEQIKKRFIKAVDLLVQMNYPTLSESDIVKTIHLTHSNFIRIKTSADYFPTLEQCATLCIRHNYSAEWLITGAGQQKTIKQKATARQLLEMATAAVKEELKKKK